MEDAINEDQLQAKCVKWFDEQYPGERKMLFSVPNGGSRDKRTATLMQATGVKKGVSDLILVLFMFTVFIELKMPGNKQSEDQIKFMNSVRERKHLYFLIFSFEEFKELIKKLIL